MQDAPPRVSAGFLSAFMVGDLKLSPFLPHLLVCGLFNHYTCGARHISTGCLDLLLVVGCSALLSTVHTLASFFPPRLDSASRIISWLSPVGLSFCRLPHSLSISVSFGW